MKFIESANEYFGRYEGYNPKTQFKLREGCKVIFDTTVKRRECYYPKITVTMSNSAKNIGDYNLPFEY